MSEDDGIEYEPVSVKEVLGEMKDIAELLIDLSYSSVLFENAALAEEVLALEDEMDLLQLQARMSLVMAGRRPEEAEALAPVFGIVGAAEKISDAAGDIAKVVLDDIGLPPALRGVLPDAVETLARATVSADSPYADRTLGDINLETETGVRVLALRRDDDWLLNPDRETRLQAEDILFCRGTEEGLARVYATITDEPFTTPEMAEQPLEDLDRAVETVALMKNMSELAVDLAYGSVLFDSPDLAEEVRELEVEVDALQSRFEVWALRAAKTVDDPVSIRGLLHIAASTEVISDAALEISEGVLRGVGSHPVVEAAVQESDEIIDRTTVASGSRLDGTTISDAEVKTRTGMHIVAIRRESAATDGRTKYQISPPPDTALRAGDVLITKGTRAGANRLADWAA
ncbi:potassium channel family protein [Halobaculum roseum]|uniref:Potassium channel family protein n=1 Tax=Halobaculum roseum TaxID=2175149 RepID=A0ABD5MP92_9EURY|nr:TrkA C-terminal domain-containing protein [Halobaculum roseum]QZY04330.1 potassium channel protein [Halobaculum roseum]